MVARLAALAAVLFCVVGCALTRPARPSGFGEGTSVHTLSVGGLHRTYGLYKPAGLPAPAPLVVMLHGGFGDGTQAERAYGWDQ
jgi:polyhydroxybutyrate depolymerase